MGSYRIPYKGRDSEDRVWTPASIKQLATRQTSQESLHEYVGRVSVEENPTIVISGSSVQAKSPLASGQEETGGGLQPHPHRQSAQSKLSTKQNDKKASKVSVSTYGTFHGRRHSTNYYRKYSGGGDNPSIIMDWNNTSGWTRMIGFNLELWWRRSSNSHRVNAGFVALCLTICLANVVFGGWLIWSSFHKRIRNPYICTEPECHKTSQWISEFMNTSVDPCDNFYDYICGDYHIEKEKEGSLFEGRIHDPKYPIEFGENSILAKMLKLHRNDPTYDQPVEYYRNCLNDEIRKKYGLDALVEAAEYVFGTRDLSTFEQSNKLSMEEIGSRMFQVTGHAAYINMAFFSYPYIQIIRPSEFTHTLHFWDDAEDNIDDSIKQNEEFATRILGGFLPLLGIPKGSTLMKDMVQGVNMMSSIVGLIDHATSPVIMPKSVKNPNEPGYKEFLERYSKRVLDRGYCPPMGGIRMDMSKVLELFLQEKDYRVEYIDLMSLKYFHALQMCFDHDRSTYVPLDPNPKEPWKYVFTYPKTAFLSIWLVELLWDFLQSADVKNLMHDWKLSITDLPHNENVIGTFRLADSDTELQCLTEMWRNLGYMPSIRFLIASQANPADFIRETEEHMERLFHKVSDIFNRIPPTEISILQDYMGRLVFSRGIHVDFIMPLVNGVLDHSAAMDILPFTHNHLNNSLIAVRYTVEKARQNWMASTNVRESRRWWGDGEPNEVRNELLDLREPMLLSAPFQEQLRTANLKLFETFLSHPYDNYALYPLTMLNEPHLSETLALKYGGMIVKQIRSFLKLVQEPLLADRYTSLGLNWTKVVFFDDYATKNGADRPCFVLLNRNPQNESYYYKYTMVPYDVFKFSWDSNDNFFSLVALKETFKLFREERKLLWRQPFNWTLGEEKRDMITQRYLPGKRLHKFSEEQLFFMSYVRHTCRGNFKTHNDYYELDRFFLETTVLNILMQTEEFAKVWKCGKRSFMNNQGLPRCMRWMP